MATIVMDELDQVAARSFSGLRSPERISFGPLGVGTQFLSTWLSSYWAGTARARTRERYRKGSTSSRCRCRSGPSAPVKRSSSSRERVSLAP